MPYPRASAVFDTPFSRSSSAVWLYKMCFRSSSTSGCPHDVPLEFLRFFTIGNCCSTLWRSQFLIGHASLYPSLVIAGQPLGTALHVLHPFPTLQLSGRGRGGATDVPCTCATEGGGYIDVPCTCNSVSITTDRVMAPPPPGTDGWSPVAVAIIHSKNVRYFFFIKGRTDLCPVSLLPNI